MSTTNLFLNKFSDLLFLNELKKIPIVCDLASTTYIQYETYFEQAFTSELNESEIIEIPTLVNSMEVVVKGAFNLLPYFFKYEGTNFPPIDLSFIGIHSTPDTIVISSTTPIFIDYIFSKFIEMKSNAYGITFLTKIFNVVKHTVTDQYLITLEFFPDTIDYIIFDTIKIVYCEVLYPRFDKWYKFDISWMMKEIYRLNGGEFNMFITSIKNCYNFVTKEIVCNCAGNSISKSNTMFPYSYNQSNLYFNMKNALKDDFYINNSIQDYKITNQELLQDNDSAYIYLLPEIIKTNSYTLFQNTIMNETHNRWEFDFTKIKITSGTFFDYYNDVAHVTYSYDIYVNDILISDVDYLDSSNLITITSNSGNFLKYDNILRIIVSKGETPAVFYGLSLDHIVRMPNCKSDFISMESLKNVDSFVDDKSNVTKTVGYDLTKPERFTYSNPIKEVINYDNKISLTEKEYLKDENYFYFALDKDKEYSLVSYNQYSGLTKIFQNCQVQSTSLSEDDSVNTKSFNMIYDKEIKYLI